MIFPGIDELEAADSVETLYTDILEMNDAFRVVSLKSESTAVDFAGEILTRFLVGGFVVIDNDLVIDLHDDFLAFDDDRFGIPLIVVDILLFHIDNVVQAAGSFPVAMTIVDLGFEAILRPAFGLKLGMEVDSAI